MTQGPPAKLLVSFAPAASAAIAGAMLLFGAAILLGAAYYLRMHALRRRKDFEEKEGAR